MFSANNEHIDHYMRTYAIVILEADKKVKHVQVNCESVVDMGYMGRGTLLQSAVKEDQEDFVQILMDFG